MRLWVFLMDQVLIGLMTCHRLWSEWVGSHLTGPWQGDPTSPSIVLQCWSRYNLQWILIPAKQCNVPWEMFVGCIKRKQHTIEWSRLKEWTGPATLYMLEKYGWRLEEVYIVHLTRLRAVTWSTQLRTQVCKRKYANSSTRTQVRECKYANTDALSYGRSIWCIDAFWNVSPQNRNATQASFRVSHSEAV